MKPTALILVVIAGLVAAMEIYTRVPLEVPSATLLPEIPADARRIVLIAHGSVDGDNPQFPALVTRLAGHYASREEPAVAVRFLRWAPWSDERLRAVATAERLGREIGPALARFTALESLDLVVHSSGAYIADSLCTSYRAAAGPQAARIEMVFLDPFQLHGFVDFRHGKRNHGRCADFALAVINTDDPAPATNAPLDHAWNIDVTAHPGRAAMTRNGHYWPVQYYHDFLPGLERELFEPDFSGRVRGEVVRDPPGVNRP
ncbi:MAG: hypothetical protein L6Q83_02655 [Gammaproteobacteria bacterium]|nr:hypothetical protein [Gammaproteobacteria bacterium]